LDFRDTHGERINDIEASDMASNGNLENQNTNKPKKASGR